MTGDRVAGSALLFLIAGGWILVFQSFNATAGLGILALLVAPFGIAGAVLWHRRREFQAPPAADEVPGSDEDHDEGFPPGGYNGNP